MLRQKVLKAAKKIAEAAATIRWTAILVAVVFTVGACLLLHVYEKIVLSIGREPAYRGIILGLCFTLGWSAGRWVSNGLDEDDDEDEGEYEDDDED